MRFLDGPGIAANPNMLVEIYGHGGINAEKDIEISAGSILWSPGRSDKEFHKLSIFVEGEKQTM